MKSNPRLGLILIVLVLLTLACDLSPATPEPTLDENAVATSVAATMAAEQTLNAPPPTDETIIPTDPLAGPTDTPDPNTVYAPDPLPVQYTGLIWDFGTCYDFDTFLSSPAEDPTTDACLNTNALITPQNGALMSGHAPLNPPSKGYCMSPDLLPDPIAPNSDLYLCLQTSEGTYGFFVMRDFQYTLDRLIFDLYLFP